MKLSTFARLTLTIFAVSFSFLFAEFALARASQYFVEPLAGDFINRQAAASVLGQPNFTTNTAGSTASKFNQSENAVIDPVSKKLFVVELQNNRVVRFSSSSALTTGAAAEAVLGQPDFATSTSGRVLTSGYRGLANAFVYLTDSEGNTRAARTTSFGYYHFEDIAAGQTVVVTVVSKRFQFAP